MFNFTPQKARIMNLVAATTFFLALILNSLANILPINGLSTGEISDTYENYFAPAGFTFSIWALIYALLAGYVVWRLKNLKQSEDHPKNRFLYRVDIAFTISNIANGLWILSWHYLSFYLSFLMMVIILISLVYINLQFKGDQAMSTIPFRVYFGWIIIATVANLTTVIVADANNFRWLWNGGEVSEQLLTIIILLVTILLGNLIIFRQKDPFVGGVIIWSLIGIFTRHRFYLPDFGITGVANMALFGTIVTILMVLFTLRKKISKLVIKS
jgi:uncharacterized MnhB-related membrane protein